MATAHLIYTNLTSPFGRKVLVAHERALPGHEFTRLPVNLPDENDPIRKVNPLGKMPCLVIAGGQVVHDSAVIIEYIDHLAPGEVLPVDPAHRIDVLVRQAVSDGVSEAGVLISVEGRYHEPGHVSAFWVRYQADKMERALDVLTEDLPSLDGKIYADAISLACALQYIDWRQQIEWRESRHSLVAWLEEFEAKVPELAKYREKTT
jgi:glutathione S-transferase